MTDIDNDLDADLLGLVGDDEDAGQQSSRRQEAEYGTRLF